MSSKPRLRWIRAESVPRELDDGTVIWEGLLVDITALKDAEQRLKSVIEAARAYTWRRDLRTGRLEYDAQWAALLGVTADKDQPMRESFLESVHPADRADVETAAAHLEAGLIEKKTMTFRRRKRSGEWMWTQMHAGISERGADGKPTVLSGVTFDVTAEVTERRQALEQLAQLREDLQRAQLHDTLAEVAGGVVHDLNNLIAVISGTADILRLHASGQPVFEDGLRRIRGSVEMARELTTSLRSLAQRHKPRESLDLRSAFEAAVDLLGSQRRDRHNVKLILPSDLRPVWSNKTELVQVILNLAINACDSGSPDRIADVTLSALPTSTRLPARPPDLGEQPDDGRAVSLFIVSDTGAGIPDAVRPQMFHPYFTTKGRGGTGLGLPIASRILRDNDAALWVDNTPGVGTTMTVAWPCTAPHASPLANSRQTEAAQVTDSAEHSAPLNGSCILVVDDLPEVAGILAEMLETADATVVTTSDPVQARTFLAETPGFWSLLVTDLQMAGLDGRALARFAADLSPPVPTVLVTARPETLEGDAVGEFAAILHKPVTMEVLVRTVREHARRV